MGIERLIAGLQLHSSNPPLLLQRINDPGRRPKMVPLKIHQQLHDLVPLNSIGNQRTPDEDGVTDRDGQWDSGWRTFACATYDAGVFEDRVLMFLVFVCYG